MSSILIILSILFAILKVADVITWSWLCVWLPAILGIILLLIR